MFIYNLKSVLGMAKLKVSKAIFEKFPQLKVGTLTISNYDNSKIDDKVLKKIKEVEEQIRKNTSKDKLSELEEIKTWRTAYASFGAKPKKYKSSIEALLRRILDGENLPSINNLVNIYNLISIKYKLPLGADDLSLVSSDVSLTFANGEEKFKAINSDEVKSPVKGEIVYKMNNDILCRRWNWRESDLTKITEKTNKAIIYVESLLENASVVNNALNELKEILGGEIRILDKTNNALDLDSLELSTENFNESYTKEEHKPEVKKEKVKKEKSKEKSSNEFYHWAQVSAERIIREKGDKETYTLAAGITPSGTIHLGNFREVITADLIKRSLEMRGKKVRFIYSWDDNDVFRKVPKNMPKQEELQKELRKPIFKIPDPFGTNDSYAEHFEKEMEKDLPLVGINPEYIYQHKEYLACKYAEEIKIALEKTAEIKTILDKFRKEPLEEGWLPIFIFCEKCNKDTIEELKWNKDYTITYKCACGNQNTVDFRKVGIVTLRWRIDWPMRWHYYNEDFEAAGKDHCAAGGSVTTSRMIQKEVYGSEPPYGFMYEWISIKGGGQFASSLGNVITLPEALEVYEPELVRYLFASTRPNSCFDISFDTDVLTIYEGFDRCERIYYGLEKVNEKNEKKMRATYELSYIGKVQKTIPYQPSFRHLTTLLQIYDFNIDKVIGYFEKELKNDHDKKRLRKRAECAANWVKKHAPEDFRFKVQEEPQVTLVDQEKKILHEVADKLLEKEWNDVELHEEMYILCKNNNFPPGDFFKLAYNVLINKDKGPRLASFILEIGKEKVAELFKKV
jgi:lysyl-tRNA synthetase, class I